MEFRDWRWWLTTVGGGMVLGLTQAAAAVDEPVRSVVLGLAGVLGLLLGWTHPGRSRPR
jgi:hypothetical protein